MLQDAIKKKRDAKKNKYKLSPLTPPNPPPSHTINTTKRRQAADVQGARWSCLFTDTGGKRVWEKGRRRGGREGRVKGRGGVRVRGLMVSIGEEGEEYCSEGKVW